MVLQLVIYFWHPMSKDEFRINDPIHGMICFSGIEGRVIKSLVDTREFQRLRRIKQLGCVDLVFPGATHTRFSHSIGVAWLANKAMKRLFPDEKSFEEYKKNSGLENYTRDHLILIVTCGGLLHDIGHSAFGHTLERILAGDTKHEKIANMILNNENTEIHKVINALCEDKEKPLPEKTIEDISYLIGNEPEKEYLTPFKSLISSEMDCDRFDYIMRDNYYCGTPIKIHVDYIQSCMELKKVEELNGYRIVFPEKAISSINHYLLSRIFHYMHIINNKAILSAECMLQNIIKLYLNEYSESSFESEHGDFHILKIVDNNDDLMKYLSYDDIKIINIINDKLNEDCECGTKYYFKYLCFCFVNRHLYKKCNVSNKRKIPISARKNEKIEEIKCQVQSDKLNISFNDSSREIELKYLVISHSTERREVTKFNEQDWDLCSNVYNNYTSNKDDDYINSVHNLNSHIFIATEENRIKPLALIKDNDKYNLSLDSQDFIFIPEDLRDILKDKRSCMSGGINDLQQ